MGKPLLRQRLFPKEIAQVCEINYCKPMEILLVFLDLDIEFLHPPDQ